MDQVDLFFDAEFGETWAFEGSKILDYPPKPYKACDIWFFMLSVIRCHFFGPYTCNRSVPNPKKLKKWWVLTDPHCTSGEENQIEMIMSRPPTEVSFLHKVKIVHRDIKPFSQKWWCCSISGKPLRWKKYGSRSIQSRGLMCFLLKTKYQNMHHLNLIDQNMWNQDRKQIIPKKMLPLFYHRPWLPLGSSCPTWVQPRTENFLLLGDVGSTEGVFCRVIDEEIRMSSRMYETIIYLSLKYNCPIPSLIYFALSIYIYTLIYVYRLC